MSVNLTDKEKQVARWLVRENREGKLPDEFAVIYTMAGVGVAEYGPDTPTFINKATLTALVHNGLLRLIQKNVYSLTQLAFDLVNANFQVAALTPSQITIKKVRNSPIQITQNSPNAVQIGVFALNNSGKADIAKFIDQLENSLSELELQRETLNKLMLHMNTIRLHLSSEHTGSVVIEESLRSIKGILEGMVGNIIVTGLMQQLAPLLARG